VPDKLDDDERPLSAAERAKLRELLKAQERADWLWSTIRVWAVWIAAVVGGFTLGWDSLKKVLTLLIDK